MQKQILLFSILSFTCIYIGKTNKPTQKISQLQKKKTAFQTASSWTQQINVCHCVWSGLPALGMTFEQRVSIFTVVSIPLGGNVLKSVYLF